MFIYLMILLDMKNVKLNEKFSTLIRCYYHVQLKRKPLQKAVSYDYESQATIQQKRVTSTHRDRRHNTQLTKEDCATNMYTRTLMTSLA